MGRSKSKKNRGQATNRTSSANREAAPTTALAVIEQVLEFDVGAANGTCDDSITSMERSLEDAASLMVSLVENELHSFETELETDPSTIRSAEISEIPGRVESLMEEAQEVKDPLDQKLTNDVNINHANLDVVLPHYKTQPSRESVLQQSASMENVRHQSDEIVFSLDLLNESFERLTRKFEQRFEGLLEDFEARLNLQIQQLTLSGETHDPNTLPEVKREATSATIPKAQQKSTKSEVENSAPESEWERRKRELLVDFGLSGDEIEQIVPKKSGKKHVDNHNDSQISSTHDRGQTNTEQPVEAAVCFTSFEIDQLKEQLTAKLREAELELSINRAKLLQESTALEQRSAEVSRREAALKSKYVEIEGTNKTGLLDRITRHLSRKTKDC